MAPSVSATKKRRAFALLSISLKIDILIMVLCLKEIHFFNKVLYVLVF